MRCLIVCLLTILACGHVHAADIIWDNTSGAGPFAFDTTTNWNPTQKPIAGDNAIFDNPGALPFLVTFAAAETSDRLIFRDDDVTFDLNGNSYALTEVSSAAPSIVVGETLGDDGVLTLTDGTLSGVYMALGLTGGSGNVEVTTDAILNLTQALTIGGSSSSSGGTGVFSIENNGAVDVDDVIVWSTGTYTQNGGTLTTSSFDNSAGGTFNFNDGTITVDGGTFDDGAVDPVIDGANPGDNPTLTLINGAVASSARDLLVGNTNQGTLDVLSGSQASNSRHVYLGSGVGSTGTMTVDGSSSTHTAANHMYVGRSGNGTLNITNGGSVSNLGSFIGREMVSTGTVTVDGSGSTWTNNASLVVGDFGNGTLNITDEGSVTNDSGFVGDEVGSVGTVTVDGSGSTWTNSLELNVGNLGNGSLDVTNGGVVSNTLGAIGFDSGSTGTATVSGSGSQWNTLGSFYVGRYGTAR